MSAKYVIRWRSKVNGRAGRGTKQFAREEGERLVAELNADYPEIEHDLITPPPPHLEADGEEEEKQTSPAHSGSYGD